MKPEIRDFPETVLVGISTMPTLATDNPTALWKPFKQKLVELNQTDIERFYSVQTFKGVDFNQFTPDTTFIKWAAVEASSLKTTPNEFEKLIVPESKYAVFVHKGTPATFHKTTNFIFGEWLPTSGFELDDRPHLTIMGKDYRADNPEAEELICIPIK